MDCKEEAACVVFRGMRFGDLLQVQKINFRNSTENFLLCTFLNSLSMSYTTSFVAELDGQIIGYSEAVFSKDKMKGHIYSICVDGPFRRCGIGRRLINLSIDAIRIESQGGRCEVDLHVRASNAEAISLYRSIGFEIREASIPYYKAGAAGHRMSLWLE
ncbi:N-acetyltransferase [Encephalitozoon hellem ATCC 50504]|uniref:N-terminal acyltransferase complex subunit Ard1 n=1 Tax=Encephalitozoon hellem TaxID=27973 RepID=A0A9Q9CA43_ENCHE|nr:N-acetyltransferase [Encephalitozoon hellem ATCC 50504]AFM98414.1 N-acetyltransferase [Encephalitozoon hellem ATCC 50504]UTX43337.1 N-terminal acyltransferase complex subunit Ard1 [Encephalitozoon hellem]WEL38799.1 N-terminal acyltransferase complex subunit Ard1 [Encephalitozoon hellem]|eukprot:XP_003887395.1 N-acetyltransferase [Encephalitozoon hellem ATCC 50504]